MEEATRTALLEAWASDQPPPRQDLEWPSWLEAAAERVLKRSGKLAKEKKQKKGARLRLQHKTRLAEIQLQRDPEDEPVRDILSRAQGHLADSLQE
jgi:hypothetical protein